VTPYLVNSQSSQGEYRLDVRKFNPATYNECKWLSGCAQRNAQSGLIINHIKILALPYHKNKVTQAATGSSDTT
jgi:hypothetical protein